MNNGFQLDLWSDYFLASAGVGAALAGLVFVALSINLARILRTPGVTGRGAEALALLVSPALVGIVGLWPLDDPARVGIAIALVGAGSWLTVTSIQFLSTRAASATAFQRGMRLVLGQLGTLPVIAAGVSLVTGVGFGLDFLVLGALSAIVAGLVGAWVLLVEILR